MRGEISYSLSAFASGSGRLFAFALTIFILFSSISVPVKASETKSDAASIMRLEKTDGTVSVANNSGKEMTVAKKMRLNDGNTVSTKEKSYAYISLDDSKAIKLDAKSQAEVHKTGSKYEAVLKKGSLFFNVSEPLSDDEEFNIKTSTMTMGIRGTGAQVEVIDEKHTRVCLLEGSLFCSMSSSLTGDSETCALIAGQKADFYITNSKTNNCKIETGNISINDIRGFVLLELLNDKALAKRIFMESGLDFRKLTSETVNARLRKDQGISDSASSNKKNTGSSGSKTPISTVSDQTGSIAPIPISYQTPPPVNQNNYNNSGSEPASYDNASSGSSDRSSDNNSSSSKKKTKKSTKKKSKKKNKKKKNDESNNSDNSKSDENQNKQDNENNKQEEKKEEEKKEEEKKEPEKKDDEKKEENNETIPSPTAFSYQDDTTTSDEDGEYHTLMAPQRLLF